MQRNFLNHLERILQCAAPSSTYFIILIIYFLDGTKVRKSLTVINLKVATNKRKVNTEFRIFQEKWTIDYFFTQINEKPVCLLCSESVSVMKE